MNCNYKLYFSEIFSNFKFFTFCIWKNKRDIFLFTVGLIVLDQSLGRLGDKLVKGPFWYNTTLSKLLKKEKIEILFIGTCRTANNIDSEIVSNRLGVQVFNAGKEAEALGNMDLSLNLALSKHTPKIVIIQVDAPALLQDFLAIRNEIYKQIIWLPEMSIKRSNDLVSYYQLKDIKNLSGFWRYKGKGEYLEVSIHKMISTDPLPISNNDGYKPQSPENHQSIIWYGEDGQKEPEYSKDSINTVIRLIKLTKEAGAKPILLVTPMHYSVGNLPIMRRLIEDIGNKEKIYIMNYVDSQSPIARDDSIWYDGTHLDKNGAERFSNLLSDDLEQLKFFK